MKEFGAIAFDEGFAAAQGWRVARVDLFMLVLLLAIVAIGLKAVGLILIIALVIIPPAAARFWTDRLGHGRPVRRVWRPGGLDWGRCISGVSRHACGSGDRPSRGGDLPSACSSRPPRGGSLELPPGADASCRGRNTGSTDYGGRLINHRTRWPIVLRAGVGSRDRTGGLRRRICGSRGRRAPSARLWQAYRQQHPDAALYFNPLSGFRIEDVLSADIVAALESERMNAADFLSIDLPAMLVAILAATSCGLLGNFLVYGVRR